MDRKALILAALTMSCAAKVRELPPLGEALIVVDTDLPHSLAQRLRIDVYTQGTWIESRDVLLLPSAASLPVSFSVFSPDPSRGRTAIVRLRVHPEGRTRPYQGERFRPRSPGITEGEGDGKPRLIRDGVDVTPPLEPSPLTAIDRLVRVAVTPGVRGKVEVLLQGECLGVMADLAGERTCVNGGELAPLELATLEPSMTIPTETRAGTFPPHAPCTVAPRGDEVCVEGALSFVGVPWSHGLFADRGVEVPALLSPFLIDRNEVTVAKFRAAVAAGLKYESSELHAHEGALKADPMDLKTMTLCTWSAGPRFRESFPLTCVSHALARRYCKFVGGDLPSEAQWQHVAVIAGRPQRTPYPWGSDLPQCADVVFGRRDEGECPDAPRRPAPIDLAPGDRTLGLGVMNMHGNVAEWMRDAFHRLYESCWYGTALHDPVCDDPAATSRAIGGVGFHESTFTHDRRNFAASAAIANHIGFRCVRAGT